MTTEPPVTRTVYVDRNRGCGSGCLWGCLVLIVLVSLPVILAGGWGFWLWNDYKHDPAMRLVRELVQHDGLAAQVLGEGVSVEGVDAGNFSWMPGASHHDYDVTLEGPRGEGHLAVTSHADGAGTHLDSAILTGPDGRRYDLLKHTILPGNEPGTDI